MLSPDHRGVTPRMLRIQQWQLQFYPPPKKNQGYVGPDFSPTLGLVVLSCGFARKWYRLVGSSEPHPFGFKGCGFRSGPTHATATWYALTQRLNFGLWSLNRQKNNRAPSQKETAPVGHSLNLVCSDQPLKTACIASSSAMTAASIASGRTPSQSSAETNTNPRTAKQGTKGSTG